MRLAFLDRRLLKHVVKYGRIVVGSFNSLEIVVVVAT